MKTLVVGGAGFIGKNLVRRLLDKNENVRVVVLRADGKHFSSGGNIEGFMNETPETLTMLAQNVMTPEKIRKPVIASIQGYCFGVGWKWAISWALSAAPEKRPALREQPRHRGCDSA